MFRDRSDAGRQLARALDGYAAVQGDPAGPTPRADVVVLALPRGGVPVGYEVARALGAPLDVFVVRKLGVPGHRELAMGAIASRGVRVLNEEVVAALELPEEAIDEVTVREQRELERQQREYRGAAAPQRVAGRTVILVDDGLATGSSMRAAVQAAREQGARALVVAVPVASAHTCNALRKEVDELICLRTPDPFYAVGIWYADFSQTSDEQVRELLARSRAEVSP